MNESLQPSWTRPESAAPGGAGAADAPAGSAASLLLSHGSARNSDSRRIAIGIAGLALLSAILLNVGIYQSERGALVGSRWVRLSGIVETKRDELRQFVRQLQRQSAYAATHPALIQWAELGADGRLSAGERRALELELERTATALNLHHLKLVGPRGERLAASRRAPATTVDAEQALVASARRTGEPTLGLVRRVLEGGTLLEVATVVPVRTTRGAAPVLISAGDAQDALGPILGTDWAVAGVAGHAYVVRRDGEDVSYLTAPESDEPANEVAPGDGSDRVAAMAASGVESNIETTGRDGKARWATTRFLPELGWGLVGEVHRDAILADLRHTVARLALLDLMLIVCVGGVGLAWRRQYTSGLARHEVMLVNRHAARIQAVLDTAFDAILTFDSSGRVRTVNHAAERMLGREAAELDGQPLHRFLRWGPPSARAGEQPLPAPGVACVAEVRRADGTAFPAEFSLGTAGSGEDLIHTAIIRDISERVEAERQIHAFAEGLETSNRRLEELNVQLLEASRLKSEFLANTSHELRTPLNGMIGFLQLVLDGLCEDRDEEREFLKQGLQCSRHLLGLINDVLDIAKIEAGKLTVEAERVDVRDLFSEVETVTHVQAKQAGIALRFEPPARTDVHVRCDLPKTKQVLINLIGNSLKFTPRGSIVVRATAHPELGHFMFEVVDTGVGIAADRQKLIFEKFTQGDGSTTRKYGGTGLGLAISRSLVELMGGVIGVTSDGEGQGTRMYFSLPVWNDGVATVPEAGEPSGEQIEGPANGALVLVVEDDPAFRSFLVKVLQKHGYRTATSGHAEGAWMLVRRLQPAAVVLDYALSCAEGAALRTGWDLAERMTADPHTRHIPLVFVTGFDQELRDKLKATAFARHPEHLMKPVDGSVLVAKLEEMVGSIQGRHVRVLMADDDPTVAAYVRKVLPEWRFHIEVANNGDECLHVLRTQPRGFDLLLLDLMMPEVSGYDVLREMTLTRIAADLPVIVLTNFPEARNAEQKRLLETGLVLDVLPKTSVHDSPQILAHIIDWHLQVAMENEGERYEEAA